LKTSIASRIQTPTGVLCSFISYAELVRASPLRDVSCWTDLFHDQFVRTILTLAELGHKTLIASFLFVNRTDDVLAEDDLVGVGPL
jgi:hypothetical protein